MKHKKVGGLEGVLTKCSRGSYEVEVLQEYVTFWVYLDENHSWNFSNRSSHYEILIYVNNPLINFYRKM